MDKIASIGEARAKDFADEAAKHRPVFMVCMDAEGHPVLTVGRTTWQEVAYALMAVQAHFQRDWGK